MVAALASISKCDEEGGFAPLLLVMRLMSLRCGILRRSEKMDYKSAVNLSGAGSSGNVEELTVTLAFFQDVEVLVLTLFCSSSCLLD